MPKRLNKIALFKLSKRRKFVLISLLLSLGIIVVQAIASDLVRYFVIGMLAISTALLTMWSLSRDLTKIGWLMAPILPTYFITSINLFYFILPENLLVKIGLIALFTIGMYSLLLTENIFVVASLRTIQLLRAAQASGFVFSLFISFLLLDTIFSFRFYPWTNAILVFVALLPIVLQAIWTSKLDETLEKPVLHFSLLLSWVLAQAAFLISIWPVSIVIASLFLVTILYVGLGIIQQALLGRLFKQTVKEYAQVGIVVLLIVLFAASWGGQ
jgi:uncharacterized protein DUF5656